MNEKDRKNPPGASGDPSSAAREPERTPSPPGSEGAGAAEGDAGPFPGGDAEPPAAPAVEPDPAQASSGRALVDLSRKGGLLAAAVLAGFLLGRAAGTETGADPADGGGTPDHAHGAESGQDVTIWTCSMHPQIRMPKPGKCPICGMDLIPATGASDAGEEDAGSAGRVKLSPRAAALAGVRTVPVERAAPASELRLLGRVEVDETRLVAVTPWIDGRIDRLHVRETGVRVRKGQVVASIYSPEVYAALRDLSTAARTAAHGGGGIAAATVKAARDRLRLLGVDADLVDAVARGGEVPEHVPVRARATGTVLRRLVEQGDYVRAGTPLYEVADLSRVWVQLEAYERDLPRIRLGGEVYFEANGVERPYAGKVVFIDPIVDPKRRIARVRVEVANRDGLLRPGMFGEAVLAIGGDAAAHPVVPASAVLFTGRRSVVYVEVSGKSGTFELRTVRLGPRAGDVYPVLEGLSEGERVVTRGAFFLDADLQLRGGRSMMTLGDDRSLALEPNLVVPKEALAATLPLWRGYLAVREDLAADRIDAAKRRLADLAKSVSRVVVRGPDATEDAFADVASRLTGHARMGATATGPGEVRRAFEQLSVAMLDLLARFGNPTDAALRVVHCPMAFDAKGARWIQLEGPTENPYFGTKMLRCGTAEATVRPGDRWHRPPPDPVSPPPRAAAGGHAHHGP